MIAVDTNILVYAHRRDSKWNSAAVRAVSALAESPSPWAIPWPCVYEFISISTHPRVYSPASTLDQALRQIDYWLESPSVTLLSESSGFWATLKELLQSSAVVGRQVHDARIAAVCLHHGVNMLYSADRDFSRFPRLRTANPLI